ncbi:MAG TPA: porin [Burkholderiaceae bacterium]|nr:porin [Burkholderiaceae bacterium]
MKKSLLALAVLGTFAGVASAQTNVTIYGIVDAGINFDNGKSAAGKKWSLASGQYNGSRLGFKGSEDLGSGLSAIFTLENGFNVDDGTLGNGGRLFGRQAWVGLNGGFGSVKLGRQYSVLYNALALIDPFGINQAGDAQRVYGYGLGKVDPMSRSDNTVTYSTQDFAGFSAQAGYKFGETAGSLNTGSSKFVGANYAKGALNVVAAYQNTDGVDFGATTTQLGAIVAPTGLGTAIAKVKTAFIGTTYDFGVAKAHLGYGNTKAGAIGELKIRNYLVGVTAPVGAGSVYGSWNRNDIKEINAGASNQYAIGYSYPLSKRTLLYTSVAYTKNDSGVRLNAAANGQNDREVQAGFRHSF